MTQTWLTFTSETDGNNAIALININMGLPNAHTTTWANLLHCANDAAKWAFQKPANEYMTGVVNYTEEPFDPGWNPSEE